MEFHFSARRISPATTKGGALAVSAYITARHKEFRIKLNNPHAPSDIFACGLVMPPGGAFTDARELWLAADKAERRKDGGYKMRGGHPPTVATHADMSLPWGIKPEAAKRLVEKISQSISESHGVGVEWSIHNTEHGIDHVHFLWTSRKVSGTTLGDKARSLNKIAMTQDPDIPERTNPMEGLRAFASKAILDETGVLWDHRSFKRRGIDRAPEPKIDRREYRRQRRELEQTRKSPYQMTELERQLMKRRTRMGERASLLKDIRSEERDIKIARIEKSWERQKTERVTAVMAPQQAVSEPLPAPTVVEPAPVGPAPSPQQPIRTAKQLEDANAHWAELKKMLEESETEKLQRATRSATEPTEPTPIPTPAAPASMMTAIEPEPESRTVPAPAPEAAPSPIAEAPEQQAQPAPSVAPLLAAVSQETAEHAQPAAPTPAPVPVQASKPAAPPQTTEAPEPKAESVPTPAPAAAPAPFVVPLHVEEPPVRIFDPLRNPDGTPRSSHLKKVAATVLHASETGNEQLLRAATAFLAVLMKKSMNACRGFAAGIIEWARRGGDRSKLPPPYQTSEACTAACQTYVRNQGGIGR